MTDDELDLFLAKYRWVFLQALQALREKDAGRVLDDPDRLLYVTKKLSVGVMRKLAKIQSPQDAVDEATVRQVAQDLVTHLGAKLLD